MSYLVPTEFVIKMVDAGKSKVYMSTKDTVIRAFMAGAILALAAAFAITVSMSTGSPLVGAMLFPVGFIMLYLMGFDLLTGVFVLVPLALIDKRPGEVGKKDWFYRRSQNTWVPRTRYLGLDDGFHPWYALQLDGLHGCSRSYDLNKYKRQGYRYVDADYALLLYGF